MNAPPRREMRGRRGSAPRSAQASRVRGGREAALPATARRAARRIERTDFVDAFTSCVQSAIVADCSDAGGAVQDCQVAAAASINPTHRGGGVLQESRVHVLRAHRARLPHERGHLRDTTIAAFTNCFPELPDADVDGGCTRFGDLPGHARPRRRASDPAARFRYVLTTFAASLPQTSFCFCHVARIEIRIRAISIRCASSRARCASRCAIDGAGPRENATRVDGGTRSGARSLEEFARSLLA